MKNIYINKIQKLSMEDKRKLECYITENYECKLSTLSVSNADSLRITDQMYMTFKSEFVLLIRKSENPKLKIIDAAKFLEMKELNPSPYSEFIEDEPKKIIRDFYFEIRDQDIEFKSKLEAVLTEFGYYWCTNIDQQLFYDNKTSYLNVGSDRGQGAWISKDFPAYQLRCDVDRFVKTGELIEVKNPLLSGFKKDDMSYLSSNSKLEEDVKYFKNKIEELCGLPKKMLVDEDRKDNINVTRLLNITKKVHNVINDGTFIDPHGIKRDSLTLMEVSEEKPVDFSKIKIWE